MPPETSFQAYPDTVNSSSDASEGSLLAAPGPAHDAPVASEAGLIADAIKRAGIAGPASIALRIAEPLAWIGGQMLWAVQPLVQGLRVGSGRSQLTGAGPDSDGIVPRLARFLEGEGNVAELVAHLETASEPRREHKATSGNPTGKDNGPF